MRLRPVSAVVQRAAAAGGSEGDVARAVIRRLTPFGQVTVRSSSLTVKSSRVNPLSTAGCSGLGLITAASPACPIRVPQVPGAVGRIGVPGQRLAGGVRAILVPAGVPGGEELRRGRRAGVILAAGLGQLLISDDPGLRLSRHGYPSQRASPDLRVCRARPGVVVPVHTFAICSAASGTSRATRRIAETS